MGQTGDGDCFRVPEISQVSLRNGSSMPYELAELQAHAPADSIKHRSAASPRGTVAAAAAVPRRRSSTASRKEPTPTKASIDNSSAGSRRCCSSADWGAEGVSRVDAAAWSATVARIQKFWPGFSSRHEAHLDKVRIQQRPSGNQSDAYYLLTDGQLCRSIAELRRHLESSNAQLQHDAQQHQQPHQVLLQQQQSHGQQHAIDRQISRQDADDRAAAITHIQHRLPGFDEGDEVHVQKVRKKLRRSGVSAGQTDGLHQVTGGQVSRSSSELLDGSSSQQQEQPQEQDSAVRQPSAQPDGAPQQMSRHTSEIDNAPAAVVQGHQAKTAAAGDCLRGVQQQDQQLVGPLHEQQQQQQKQKQLQEQHQQEGNSCCINRDDAVEWAAAVARIQRGWPEFAAAHERYIASIRCYTRRSGVVAGRKEYAYQIAGGTGSWVRSVVALKGEVERVAQLRTEFLQSQQAGQEAAATASNNSSGSASSGAGIESNQLMQTAQQRKKPRVQQQQQPQQMLQRLLQKAREREQQQQQSAAIGNSSRALCRAEVIEVVSTAYGSQSTGQQSYMRQQQNSAAARTAAACNQEDRIAAERACEEPHTMGLVAKVGEGPAEAASIDANEEEGMLQPNVSSPAALEATAAAAAPASQLPVTADDADDAGANDSIMPARTCTEVEAGTGDDVWQLQHSSKASVHVAGAESAGSAAAALDAKIMQLGSQWAEVVTRGKSSPTARAVGACDPQARVKAARAVVSTHASVEQQQALSIHDDHAQMQQLLQQQQQQAQLAHLPLLLPKQQQAVPPQHCRQQDSLAELSSLQQQPPQPPLPRGSLQLQLQPTPLLPPPPPPPPFVLSMLATPASLPSAVQCTALVPLVSNSPQPGGGQLQHGEQQDSGRGPNQAVELHLQENQPPELPPPLPASPPPPLPPSPPTPPSACQHEHGCPPPPPTDQDNYTAGASDTFASPNVLHGISQASNKLGRGRQPSPAVRQASAGRRSAELPLHLEKPLSFKEREQLRQQQQRGEACKLTHAHRESREVTGTLQQQQQQHTRQRQKELKPLSYEERERLRKQQQRQWREEQTPSSNARLQIKQREQQQAPSLEQSQKQPLLKAASAFQKRDKQKQHRQQQQEQLQDMASPKQMRKQLQPKSCTAQQHQEQQRKLLKTLRQSQKHQAQQEKGQAHQGRSGWQSLNFATNLGDAAAADSCSQDEAGDMDSNDDDDAAAAAADFSSPCFDPKAEDEVVFLRMEHQRLLQTTREQAAWIAEQTDQARLLRTALLKAERERDEALLQLDAGGQEVQALRQKLAQLQHLQGLLALLAAPELGEVCTTLDSAPAGTQQQVATGGLAQQQGTGSLPQVGTEVVGAEVVHPEAEQLDRPMHKEHEDTAKQPPPQRKTQTPLWRSEEGKQDSGKGKAGRHKLWR